MDTQSSLTWEAYICVSQHSNFSSRCKEGMLLFSMLYFSFPKPCLCLYPHYKTPTIWAGHSRAVFQPVTGFSVNVHWKHKGSALNVTMQRPLHEPVSGVWGRWHTGVGFAIYITRGATHSSGILLVHTVQGHSCLEKGQQSFMFNQWPHLPSIV